MSNQESAPEAARYGRVGEAMQILQAQADAGNLTFSIMSDVAGLNPFQPQSLELVSCFLSLLRSLELSESQRTPCAILRYRLIGNLLKKAGEETGLRGQVLLAYFSIYPERLLVQLYDIASYGFEPHREHERMTELLATLPDNRQSRELFSPAAVWGEASDLSIFAFGYFFRHTELSITSLIRYCMTCNRELARRAIIEVLWSGGVCTERLADAREFADPFILVEMAREYSSMLTMRSCEENFARQVTEAFEHALRLIPPTKQKGYLAAIESAIMDTSRIHDSVYVAACGFLVEYLYLCQAEAPLVVAKTLRLVVASGNVSLAIAVLERRYRTLRAHVPAVDYRNVSQLGVRRQQILRLLLEAEGDSARERILAALPDDPVWVWDLVVEALRRDLPQNAVISDFLLSLYQNSLVDRRYMLRTLYSLKARTGKVAGAHFIGILMTSEADVLDYFLPKRQSATRRKPKQVAVSR